MKVVINKKIGVFHYTEQQARWLFNRALNHKDLHSDIFNLRRLVADIIDSFGEAEDKSIFRKTRDSLYIIFHSDDNDYRYRSHPWIVDACTTFPDESQKIEEVSGGYYRIVEVEDGTEYIITPDLEDFIKGF